MLRRFLLFLIALCLPLPGQNIRPLTILHSNDIHAHLLPDAKGNGGMARLATAVRREKQNCAPCLYLNAGDIVQGTPVSTIFHGAPVYEIANLLGFDVSTLGNHEFDYGWKRTLQFVKIAHFPIVSANVVDDAGRTIVGKPWLIKEAGGIRVGIIGELLGDLVPDEVPRESAGPYHVVPVLESVKKYAAELRDKTDLIVVLGHIHDKEEVAAILQQIPDVSVVVAGHAHTAYPEMMKTEGRVAVLVNAYADQLGRLDLQVDIAAKKLQSAQWKKIPVLASLEPAADVDALVKKWEGRVTGIVDVPVGESENSLHRTDPELRKLLEKAIAEETHTDIVWINAGGIRDNLPKGRLMARDIWNMLPFDDHLMTGKFLGKELPKSITDRYPVEPNKEYTVGVPDFVAQNTAGELKNPGLRFPKKGPLLRDAVIAWIRKKKTVAVTAAPVRTQL